MLQRAEKRLGLADIPGLSFSRVLSNRSFSRDEFSESEETYSHFVLPDNFVQPETNTNDQQKPVRVPRHSHFADEVISSGFPSAKLI